MANKKNDWVSKAIQKPGQLHRDLNIPPGQKIPRARLEQAAKQDNKTGERARLALTLRKMNPPKSGGKGK